jgi:protein-tyrosine phosphatase
MKADWSEVHPGLFAGSALVVLPSRFDVVVFAAAEHQEPYDSRGQLLVYLPLDDVKPSREDEVQVIRVATYLAAALRAGQTVLVTCNQGRNRSCWIAGATMRMLGVPYRQVVARIRRLRGPDALSNRWFLASLEEI